MNEIIMLAFFALYTADALVDYVISHTIVQGAFCLALLVVLLAVAAWYRWRS